MVYFIQFEAGGPIKIGYTFDFKTRVLSHRRNREMRPACVLGVIRGADIRDEREIQRRFRHLAVSQGASCEWFRPESELVDYIRSECEPWDGGCDRQLRPYTIQIEVTYGWYMWFWKACGSGKGRRHIEWEEFLKRAILAYARRRRLSEDPPDDKFNVTFGPLC